ncbi:MAG TPA: YihY/virulence factor BrkB family protein [Candidatus Limnocylindrales bacterium]
MRVLDRFNKTDGGLLAAGIAFNAVFALIPLALFATGVAGFLVSDPQSRDDIVEAVAEVFPPLAGIVNDILKGLAASSTTATLLGLVIAGWGTSRLFASLESAIAQLDLGVPRRNIVHLYGRRILSVLVVGGIVLLALLAAPILSLVQDTAAQDSVASSVLDLLLFVLPPVLGAVALAVIYRIMPLIRPSWRAVVPPAILGGLVLVILTRAFVFLAPRLFAGNVVYGTLGAILVGLTWLDLVFMVILIGAAWVVERRTSLGVEAGTAVRESTADPATETEQRRASAEVQPTVQVEPPGRPEPPKASPPKASPPAS